MQLSILIHNAILESSYLKHEWILSLCILCLHSTHTIKTYPIWVSHSWSCTESSLLSNKSTWYYIHYCYSNKQVTIILNPSTNQIRVIVATLQQLLVYSLSRYYTIVNLEDDIHNPAQTMCHHSRMSLFTPSTPSRTYPDSRCSTHSSPRPEGESRYYAESLAPTPNAASDLPIPPFPLLLDRYRIDRASRC